jgi:type IV fimbrial biogenesis protein FimT
MRRLTGFTLIEFMTTLTIAAIFMAVIVPGYRAVSQNNRVVTIANKLTASLAYARMEAVRRSAKVSVCPTANAGFTACGASSQWSQGWIVFVDANNDNTINASSDLVKVSEAPGNGTTITSASSMVSYDDTGFVQNGATSFVVTATGCTGTNARTINLSSSGRISVVYTTC